MLTISVILWAAIALWGPQRSSIAAATANETHILFPYSFFQSPGSLFCTPSDCSPSAAFFTIFNSRAQHRTAFVLGKELQLGAVAHVLNPNSWQAEAGGLL